MTKTQKEFLGKLELALANMIHDGHKEFAKILSVIIEYLHKGEYVVAVLEGENMNLDERVLEALRTAFCVKKWR